MTMQAIFHTVTLEMTHTQAHDCSRPGQDATDAVSYLTNQPHIRRQLAKITDADLAAELAEWGAWEPHELTCRADNERRLVWLAACQITETYGRPGERRPRT